MKKNKKAFTIIEIMVAILIVSIVLVSWFQLYTMALASKIRIMEYANLEKNTFYFTEKIFQLVKKWWTLDYEEYWNRKIVWLDVKNGYYSKQTWFWNSWEFYYCLSFPWKILNENWCVTSNNTKSLTLPLSSSNFSWKPQRYWEYFFQFIDYNSNVNNDNWDENNDSKINWDDDDSYMWKWPEVFWAWSYVKELYLISRDRKKRTFIRWNQKQDPFLKSENQKCQNDKKYCQWTIEYLELEGKDWWLDHISWNSDNLENDWVVDTWVIATNFSWKTNENSSNSIIAWGSETESYWKELFSEDINISDFKIFAYPNIDSSKVWNMTPEQQKKFIISPYVTFSITVEPSWKVKTKLNWNISPIDFNTTINLTDIFSN